MSMGWLEPRTRIPFAGIIAMVVIVAVVAIFIKTQLAPLFPESDVTTQATGKNAVGSASDSFYGERVTALRRETLLQGGLTVDGTATDIRVDPTRHLLVLRVGREEFEVPLNIRGDILEATFDRNGVQTRAAVDLVGLELRLSEPGVSNGYTAVTLTRMSAYVGTIELRGRVYSIIVRGNTMSMSGDDQYTVDLGGDNTMLTGTWSEHGKEHPVIIDTVRRTVTIRDVY